MSECSEVESRSSKREEEVLVGNNLSSSSSRDVVGNLPSCMAGSKDNMVGNHLAQRRLSLPVSFDLRFVILVMLVAVITDLSSGLQLHEVPQKDPGTSRSLWGLPPLPRDSLSRRPKRPLKIHFRGKIKLWFPCLPVSICVWEVWKYHCKAHLNSCNSILGTPGGNHQLKVLLHLLLWTGTEASVTPHWYKAGIPFLPFSTPLLCYLRPYFSFTWQPPCNSLAALLLPWCCSCPFLAIECPQF